MTFSTCPEKSATTPDKPKPALKPAQEPENPSAVTVDVEAVEVPEMTEEEQSDRLNLERKVQSAFVEAGKALTQLRDRKLYRSTHKTKVCFTRADHSY